MSDLLRDRPVFVVGAGLHRYQRASPTPYVALGLAAVRRALADAGLGFADVDSAYVASVMLGAAPGRAMLRYLGASGLSIAQVENASASGSSAFRLACLEVASGECDVALAVGVDKPGPLSLASARVGPGSLGGGPPAVGFALLARSYLHRHGATREQLAGVAVKNHGNAARNPYAHFQKPRTLDDVLRDAPIAGVLTRPQCCPIGEGAAAALVASARAVERLGLDRARAVRVLSSVSRSERVYGPGESASVELTRDTAARALERAGLAPADLDLVELHDAFSIEELLYTEAIGLCAEGEGGRYLESGATAIGGECAVSASGGLLGMGHPFGPTGIGQVAELTRQLRGEAGPRQHPGAARGLAHMVGIGQVCVVHVLAAGSARD